MSEEVRSMRVELSMKDMGVERQLSSIKRSFSTLRSEMVASSKMFSYSEKSTESYKKRLSELAAAEKATESGLKTLKRQYQEVGNEQGFTSAKAQQLQKEIANQEKELHFLSNSLQTTTADFKKFQEAQRIKASPFTKIANSLDTVGGKIGAVGDKMQSVGGSMTSSITKPALVAGGAIGAMVAKLGFDRLVGLDTAKAKLKGLGYSTKEVGSITDQVTNAIKGGMTTMAEGTDIAAGALAAGVKEGKDLEKYIRLVGDAAAGSGRPVADMAQIFNRVQGQGKLMTEELNMVEEGMPGFASAMAKNLGVSQEEFRKMVTEGKVSSEEFMTVMDDFAGGMSKEYAKSWQGMVQNTKSYVGILGENLLSGVFEQSKGSLREFEKLMRSEAAQKWAKDTGEKLAGAFTKISNGIQGVIKWYQGLSGGQQKALGGLVKWLGITLVTMGPVLTMFGKFASVIRSTFSGLSGIIGFLVRHNAVAKISAAAQAIWNGVTATARGIANGYRAAVAALSTSQTIQALKTKIASAATVVWTAVTKAASLAMRGLGLALRFATGPVGLIITAIGLLVAGIIYLWKTNSTFRNIVIATWNAIKAAAISVFGFIKPYIIAIWNGIKTVTFAVWNAIKTTAIAIWNGIKFAVQNPIQALKNILSAIWNGIKAAAVAIWNGIKSAVMFIVKGWINGIKLYIYVIKTVITTVFNFIKKWSIKIWNGIKNGVMFIVKGWITGIKLYIYVIRKVITTVFNFIKTWSVKIWNGIKNGIVRIVRVLSSTVRNVFNFLKNGIVKTISILRGWLIKAWNFIKNKVVGFARSLWNGVRNIFNSLSAGTRRIFNAVRSFLYGLWLKIKNKVVALAQSLWNGVKSKFNALSSGTKNIFNKVRNYLVDKWQGIKDKVVDIVSGLWGSVKKTFTNMKNGIKGFAGKIGDTITGMVDGIKKGINALIKAVNWTAGKLGVEKKIPELHTGTSGASGSLTSHGAMNQNSLATVNDKGSGNGTGINGHQEVIQKANGTMIAPKGRNVTVPLEKGDIVHNGRSVQKAQQAGVLPRFSKGTGSNNLLKGAKKHKKHDEINGDVAGQFNLAGGGKLEDAQKWVAEQGGKLAGKAKKGKDTVVAGAKAVKDKIGDVLDYVGKPGKLFDAVMGKFGVDFGKIKGQIPKDLWGGMWKTLKNATKSLFSGWLEDADGGDGGYIDLSKGINFPFSPNGKAPGYPFAGPHMGVDLNYVYDKLYSVLNGKATARKGWNGGFGNMVDIVKGNLKVIYGHMSKHAFSGSKNVKPGDYLGVSGNSGKSSGPHLHFEVQKNGTPIDPIKWLKSNNGGGGKSGKWNGDIKKALKVAGLPTSNAYIKAWQKQIQTESGGNPKALGGTDGLADGRAKGLVQVKPGTFNAYKAPGHGNIWNGLDNLIAGMRYAKARYGTKGMLSAIGKGHGYKTGGIINSNGMYNLGDGNGAEVVIPLESSRRADALKLMNYTASKIGSDKGNKRPNQISNKYSNSNSNDELLNALVKMVGGQQEEISLLKQLVASSRNIEQKPTGFNERDVSRAQGARYRMDNHNRGGGY